MKTNGLLSNNEGNTDFSNYSIVATFQKIIDLPDDDPKDQKLFKAFNLRVLANNTGDFQLELPDKKELDGSISFKVLAPNGEFLKEKTFDKLADFDPAKKLEIDGVKAIVPFIINAVNNAPKPKISGKVIDYDGKSKVLDKQVLIWARNLGSEPKEYFVVIATKSNAIGQFNEDIPLSVRNKGLYNERFIIPEYEDAYATVEDYEDEKIPIILENRRLPKLTILIVGNEKNKKEEDCGCEVENGKCVDFTTPNRTLEEFNYSSIVRTTDPEIKGFTLEDVKPLSFTNITKYISNLSSEELKAAAPVRSMKKAETNLNLSVARNILSKDPDGFTPANLMTAERLTVVNNIASIVGKLLKKYPGRSVMSADNPIDWDDEPTFYQASTIAHGHLLHFKQVWKADGYSLGDLLYSLPLAPRQRKQIAIVDWDRREDASRLEFSLASEDVAAMIARDRDISEISKATVHENVSGGSEASTWAAGGGLGLAIGPLVLGAAGGGGGASSTAWQNSSRSASASMLNQLRDKTVQAASSVRSQRTSVVQSVRQGETMKVTTETVGNPNHCHAMTMEYFEVLRHFQVSQEIADVQECLFVPLLMSRFDRDKLLRWKDGLKARLRNRKLLSAFDGSERIKNNWDGSNLPLGRYADDNIEYIDGELRISFKLVRPDDNIDDSFNLSNWANYQNLLWESASSIFNQFLSGRLKAERDIIFQRDIAPRIAEAFVQNLNFELVTSSGSYFLALDPTLVSNYNANTPLYVSLRAAGSVPAIPRSSIIRFKIYTTYPLPPYSKTIINSGTVRYRTNHISQFLFQEYAIRNDLTNVDPVEIPTFLNSQELRNPRDEDREMDKKLIAHLNEHIEYYHRMIWLHMDGARRYMLLDGFIAPNSNGRSVASVVENKLIGIVGNCLVMPVARGFNLDPTYQKLMKEMQGDGQVDVIEESSLLDLYQPISPIPPMKISVPTRGVFAEAVMGKCNSCEVRATENSWVYDDKDFDLTPTAINPIGTDSRRTDPGDLTAKDFAQPIVNIQNSPSAPDPIGFNGLVNMLSNPSLFKDITGLEMNQKNALAAFQSAMSTSQFFGGQAAQLEMQKRMLDAKNMNNVMQNIQKAKKDGLITEAESNDLTKNALQSMIGQAKTTPASESEKKPSLTDAAVKAVEQGKDVKAQKINKDGTSESVEVKSITATEVGSGEVDNSKKIDTISGLVNYISKTKPKTKTDFVPRITDLNVGDVEPFHIVLKNPTCCNIVYLAGDNNLSDFVLEDLIEMQNGAKNDYFVSLCLFDLKDNTGMYVVEINNNKISLLERWTVNKDNDLDAITVFLAKALASYRNVPNKMMGFWGHGSTSFMDKDRDFNLRDLALLPDDNTDAHGKERVTQLKHLRNCIQQSFLFNQFTSKFDVIYFDACLLQTAEMCSEMRKFANFQVASEQLVPGKGFNYQTFIDAIVSNSLNSGDSISLAMTNSYKNEYTNNDDKTQTLSAIDLSKIEELETVFLTFVDHLLSMNDVDFKKISQSIYKAFNSSIHFPFYSGRPNSLTKPVEVTTDMIEFLSTLKTQMATDGINDAPLDTVIDNNISFISSLILSAFADEDLDGNPVGEFKANGLSIWLVKKDSILNNLKSDLSIKNPRTKAEVLAIISTVKDEQKSFYTKIDFVQKTKWFTLMERYILSDF